jgi:2'-5' RNA ligase
MPGENQGVRLFAAAYPSAEAVAHLSQFVGTLHVGRPAEPGRSLRVVPPDRWHLTLAFLGDVDDRADDAAAAVAAAAAAWREAGGQVPQLAVAGGGRFGRGRFTVLWAGVDGEVPSLDDLATRLRQALRRARLPVDRKPFRAHLTLARPGDRLAPGALAADLSALAAYRGPSWQLTELHLVRSHLGPSPSYETVTVAPLAADPRGR